MVSPRGEPCRRTARGHASGTVPGASRDPPSRAGPALRTLNESKCVRSREGQEEHGACTPGLGFAGATPLGQDRVRTGSSRLSWGL